MVVVTTDKVYADPDSGRRFAEADPLGGKDPYSASKAAAELVAAAFRDSYGLRVATARAGNVIGGGDWAEDRILPDAVRAAEAGRPLVVRDPAAVRPWQHVLNPLSGYLLLAERLAGSADYARAWNFAPPLEHEQRPVGWLVERFGAALGAPLEVRSPERRDGPVEAARLGLDPTLASRGARVARAVGARARARADGRLVPAGGVRGRRRAGGDAGAAARVRAASVAPAHVTAAG